MKKSQGGAPRQMKAKMRIKAHIFYSPVYKKIKSTTQSSTSAPELRLSRAPEDYQKK